MRRLDVNSYGALGRFRLVLLVEALQNGGEVRCAGRRALRTQEHGHAADGFCRLIIGVPEELREQIFRPFYRAPPGVDPSRVGLGLALVKALVQALGGTIGVERSTLGRASFFIELPEGEKTHSTLEPKRAHRHHRRGGAGTKVASKIARLDHQTEVTLVERGDALSYAGCGLPYYIAGVVHEKRELMSTPLGAVRDPVFFQNLKNVRVMNRTEAVEINRVSRCVKVQPSNGGRPAAIPYDKLVLATGARPIQAIAAGAYLANIFTAHGVRDAEGIRGHLDAARPRRRDRGQRPHRCRNDGKPCVAWLPRDHCRNAAADLQILDADMARLLGEAHGGTRRAHAHWDGARGFVGKERVEGVQTDTHGVIPADLVIPGVGVQAELSLARVAPGNRADRRHPRGPADADIGSRHLRGRRLRGMRGPAHGPPLLRSKLIPLGTLRARPQELPRGRDIVVFCRLSLRGYEASLILRAAGFERVKVLDGGTAMWPFEIVTGRT